jgi:cytidylate kinase
VPVITVDGPTASGKGTLAAAALARRLGWHFLDSGACIAPPRWRHCRAGVELDDEPALARLAAGLDLRFVDHRILLDGTDVGERGTALGGNGCHGLAGLGAAEGARGAAGLQLSFRRAPGLVADGRDMGTVIFPHAALKVFLTASAAERAARRHKQLISKGIQR